MMNEEYTIDYLKHIRIMMVNRIWQNIHCAIQESDKDWHFEYRESDLAWIIGERNYERMKEIDILLKRTFPSCDVYFRVDHAIG